MFDINTKFMWNAIFALTIYFSEFSQNILPSSSLVMKWLAPLYCLIHTMYNQHHTFLWETNSLHIGYPIIFHSSHCISWWATSFSPLPITMLHFWWSHTHASYSNIFVISSPCFIFIFILVFSIKKNALKNTSSWWRYPTNVCKTNTLNVILLILGAHIF